MSNLFGLLDLGSAALSAHSAGVAVAGNNAANADTEGYSRQRVDLRAELAAPLVGGVRAEGPRRADTSLLGARARDAAGAASLSRAFADALMDLDASLSGTGADVAGAIADLFARFGDASSAPMDAFVRRGVVQAARDLAANIAERARQVAQARADADARIRERTKSATELAAEIAELNRRIATTDDPTLRDRRDLAATQLAGLVGGRARIDPDDRLRFVLSGGAVLVDGDRAAKLEATPDASLGGMVRVDLVAGTHTRNVTAALDGGTIGGDLRFRDDASVQTADDLDQLAYDLATQVNATHRANAGLDGVTGRDLFVDPTAVAGAAASMAVDPTVDSDPDAIALAAAGAGPADNNGALAMLAMRDRPLAAGGTLTFVDAGIDLVATVGHAAVAADRDSALRATQRDHIAGLRDAVAGVSIQEELTRLSRFQRAAEASTRFVSTVDQLLGDIINRL